MILPDLLKHELDLVICGTAAGNKSAKREAYYAGVGNLLYQTLARCAFTSRQLNPTEYPELLDYNIGLTDLAKFTFGMDKDLKPSDYDIKSFTDKILVYQPRFVCFNGKTAASMFLNVDNTKLINYGLQEHVIGATRIFIAPSTSPRAYAYWDESTWASLRTLIKS